MLQSRPFLHKLQKKMINGWYHMINYNGTIEKWKNEGYTAKDYFRYFCHVWNKKSFSNLLNTLYMAQSQPISVLRVFKLSLINTTEKIENIYSEYFLWCGTTALPLAVIESNHSVEPVVKKNIIIKSKKRLDQTKLKALFFNRFFLI